MFGVCHTTLHSPYCPGEECRGRCLEGAESTVQGSTVSKRPFGELVLCTRDYLLAARLRTE